MNYRLKGTVTSAVFVVGVLLIMSFFVLTPVFSAIILGAVFAYGIRPISKKILPYLKFETISIILSMIIVILPLIVLLIIIINSLIESAPLIVGIVKNAGLGNISASTIQQYPLVQQYAPAGFETYIDSFLNTINVGLGDILRNILNYFFLNLNLLCFFIFFFS